MDLSCEIVCCILLWAFSAFQAESVLTEKLGKMIQLTLNYGKILNFRFLATLTYLLPGSREICHCLFGWKWFLDIT